MQCKITLSSPKSLKMSWNLVFVLCLIMAANLVDSRLLMMEKSSNENEQGNGEKLMANDHKMVNLGDMKDSQPLPNIPFLPPIPGTGSSTPPSAPAFPFPMPSNPFPPIPPVFPFPMPTNPFPPIPGLTPLPPFPNFPLPPLPTLPPIPTIPFLTPPAK